MNELTVTGATSIRDIMLSKKLTPEQMEIVLADTAGANLVGLDIIGTTTPKIAISYDKDAPWYGKFEYSLDPTRGWEAFRGVLVKTSVVNGYWADEYDGARNAPDCVSDDGIRCSGGTNPCQAIGFKCADCPKSKWTLNPKKPDEKKPSIPPECTVFMRMLVFHEEGFLCQITSTPTSLKHFKKYMSAIANRRQPSYFTWSHFSILNNRKDKLSWWEIVPRALSDAYPAWEDFLPLLGTQNAKEGFVDDIEDLGAAAAVDRAAASDGSTGYVPPQGTAPDKAPTEKPKRTRKPKEEPPPQESTAGANTVSTPPQGASAAGCPTTLAFTPPQGPAQQATLPINPPKTPPVQEQDDDELPF